MSQATGTKPSRREEILATAVRLFAQRGYGSTSVDEIGEALGISGPALYWHFKGKEAMLGEALTEISDALLAGGQRCREEGSGGLDTLERLVEGHVDFALTRRELITLQERDLVHVEAEAARSVRRAQRSYVELWVDALLEVEPAAERSSVRDAVHATFGLINSTPHLSGSPEEVADLLRRLALASLLASLNGGTHG